MDRKLKTCTGNNEWAVKLNIAKVTISDSRLANIEWQMSLRNACHIAVLMLLAFGSWGSPVVLSLTKRIEWGEIDLNDEKEKGGVSCNPWYADIVINLKWLALNIDCSQWFQRGDPRPTGNVSAEWNFIPMSRPLWRLRNPYVTLICCTRSQPGKHHG